MKKAITIACLTIFVFSANAQLRIKPGIRAGINFSKFTNSETDLKPDFFVGGSIGIKFTKFYTFQPELTYSRQGAKEKIYIVGDAFDPAYSGRKIETNYSLDYLSMAIINKFTFGPGFQVMVGPSVDFKVNDNFAKYSIRNPQDLDVCLIAGVGFAFKNGFAVDLRLKQGLIDLFGYDRVNYNYDSYNYDGYYYENNNGINDVVLNQVIQLGVSYTFDVK